MSVLFIAVLCAQLNQAGVSADLKEKQTGLYYIGIKAGPYTPNIDGEFSGKASPYKDIFGTRARAMVRGQLSYIFNQPFGQVGVSVSAGYFAAQAHALVLSTEERSGGQTKLWLVPVTGEIEYRFDRLLSWVPVLPYAGVGLSYTFWRITKGDGETANVDGASARGGSLGLVLKAGLALSLERLEPRIGKLLNERLAIKGSELTAEMVYVRAKGFGSDRLDVGDLTFQMGYSIAF